MQRGPEPPAGSSPVADRWSAQATIELTVLAILLLAVRFVDLGRPPFIDEMNHVLAAASVLADGTLTIHEGVAYDRGALFTYLVAGSYALFGQSLEVARLPALISGVLLVCLLFAWLRVEAGRVAGWTAGLLLGLAPVSIYLSQWVRFYTLHALFFWLAAWGLYRLVERRDPVRRRWWIAGGSLLALAAALHLQVTTVVGAAGLGVFVALVEGPRLLTSIEDRMKRFATLAAFTILLGVAFGLMLFLGGFSWLAAHASEVDFWAIERASNIRFYHYLFMEQYGFLWALLPLAGLLAFASRWRLALLFLCVFGIAVVIHSIAAWKAERYVYYAIPAWFAVWGLAAAELLPWLWGRLVEGSKRSVGRLATGARRAAVAAAVFVAFAFASTGLEAYTTTRLLYVQGRPWTPPPGHTGEQYAGHPDWGAVDERLDAIDDEVDVVIGEPDLKVVYYLGDLDYVLFAGYLVQTASAAGPHELRPEFTLRDKIGRPLISTPGSIELLMACHASGLIVGEEHVWGWRGGVPRETADFIEAHARPVELPEDSGILAFRWETPEPESSPRCAALGRDGAEDAAEPMPAETAQQAVR